MLRTGAIIVTLSTCSVVAEAGKTEGVAIGAGAGAIVAGPVGAVVGGVVGYNVGGPNIVTKPRTCWRDDRGRRHCRR
jgi:outer membrane lipoprotein SlyB